MNRIIPTYSEYIYEAKTLGHEFEQAVYFAIIDYVNKNEICIKPLKVKINSTLIGKYTMIERDIEKLFKLIFQEYGNDLLVKNIELVGGNNTARKFEIKNDNIVSPLTPGKDLADILIKTNKNPIYLSLKYGTSLVTLCNIGITKFSDNQIQDVFDFMGFDKTVFTSGLDDYTNELYTILKDANEITINNNVKIRPPKSIDDQKILYDWFDNVMKDNFPDTEVVVGNYTNWVWKNKGKWYGRTKPFYDTDPDNALDSSNHLNRLLDIALAILENKIKLFDNIEDLRTQLIGTEKVSSMGKIKVNDQFFKFSTPQKTKKEFTKPGVERSKYKNYESLLHWSLGKPGDYFIYFGHPKKDGLIFQYNDKYINNNLKVSEISVETMPSSLTKSLILKVSTNSQDDYFLSIRNKSGGIKPQILTITQRKKW